MKGEEPMIKSCEDIGSSVTVTHRCCRKLSLPYCLAVTRVDGQAFRHDIYFNISRKKANDIIFDAMFDENLLLIHLWNEERKLIWTWEYKSSEEVPD